MYTLRAAPVFVLIVLAIGCEPGAPPGYGIGNRAPDISGRDVDGKPIRLADFQGKVVLVDFWATWCGPCVALIPHEKEIANLYKGRPFVILGINRDRDPATLRDFLKDVPLPWPNIFDGNGEVTKSWGIDAFPSFALIDDQGIIQGRWRGGSGMSEIEEKIQRLVRIAESR